MKNKNQLPGNPSAELRVDFPQGEQLVVAATDGAGHVERVPRLGQVQTRTGRVASFCFA